MLKRITALIHRDIVSTGKDYLLLYATVAPLILALGFRFFMPSLNQATVNVVLTRQTAPRLADRLAPYLNVEVVADRAALERRVLAYDDTVGIVEQNGIYTVLLEGNETYDSQVLPERVLRRILGNEESVAAVATVDITGEKAPFREIVGAFLGLGTLFLTGTVMGFLIIEDKECRTLQALGVSPMTRREYVVARSLVALVLAVVVTLGGLWLLGLRRFDPLQVLAITATGSLVAALVGFVIGALSANQIAGIANVKFGALLFLLPGMLALLLPERWHPAMYWLPPYWSFTGLRTVLESGASWATLEPMLAWSLGTSAVFIAVCYPWLRGKLDFARN